MEILKSWYQRTFSNPQVVILAFFIIAGIVLISFFGGMLTPVFASLIIAYLLEAVVVRMEHQKIPRLLAVILVFSLFLTALIFLLFGLVPLLTGQLTQLVQQIPNYMGLEFSVLFLYPLDSIDHLPDGRVPRRVNGDPQSHPVELFDLLEERVVCEEVDPAVLRLEIRFQHIARAAGVPVA